MIKDALRPRYVFVSSPGFVRQPLSAREHYARHPFLFFCVMLPDGREHLDALPASGSRRRGQPLGGYARCATMVILDHADW